MPPKVKRSKRKKTPPVHDPIQMSRVAPTQSNSKIPTVQIQVNPNTIQNVLLQSKLNPLLNNSQKVYNEIIDFDQNFLQLEKIWVSTNPLPEQRFGEKNISKIDFVRTPLQDSIDRFLKMVYSPSIEKDQFWITGPSGTGKTYNLLTNVLKSRRFEKNVLIIHMILFEQYLNQFAGFFFNDLVYGFYPLLEDHSFPSCPEVKKKHKTGSPLKDWLLYLCFEINKNPRDLSCLERFLDIAKMHMDMSQKQLIIIVDQTNIYQRLKRENKYHFMIIQTF